jgi:hypothetical protein
MGYQITSETLVRVRRPHATERMTEAVWLEIIRRTDIVQLASACGLAWPELALGRKGKVEIPNPLANALADALDEVLVAKEIANLYTDGGELSRDTARRVIYILRAGAVKLERTPPWVAGVDVPEPDLSPRT